MRACVISTKPVELAESPVWDSINERLLYLDFAQPTVIEIAPARRTERHHVLVLPAPLGGLCQWRNDELLVACREGIFRIHSDSLHVAGQKIAADRSFCVAPPNDIGVHPTGHVLLVTADLGENSPTGGVFIFDGREIRRMASGYIVGNGPVCSPDGGTVYIADSPRGVIYAYDWDEGHCSIHKRRIFATVPRADGLPDGMTVDEEGCVWSARWGGSSVVRHGADGRERGRIHLPARLVTSCAFGGCDLKTLFITTARSDSAPGDLGGHLFSADLDVPGLPSVPDQV